jgi:membrane protein
MKRRQRLSWTLVDVGPRKGVAVRPIEGKQVTQRGAVAPDSVAVGQDDAGADSGVPATAVARNRVAAAGEHVKRLRAKTEATTAGEVQRRVSELDILNSAAILSALGMVLVVPALVSLAAILPVGSSHGLAASWMRHLALSPEAAAAVRTLFSSGEIVHTSTTVVSALFTIVSAYAWPLQLQRAYLKIWSLPSRGMRDLWRPVLWVPSLFCLVGLVAASGRIFSGVLGAFLTALIGLPVALGWAWWTQHLLLSGRIRWRALLPGAIATAVGLALTSVVSAAFLSKAIIYNSGRYGPLGVVFVMMTWLTAFSVVILAGALTGHTLWRRHDAVAADRLTPAASDDRSG